MGIPPLAPLTLLAPLAPLVRCAGSPPLSGPRYRLSNDLYLVECGGSSLDTEQENETNSVAAMCWSSLYGVR